MTLLRNLTLCTTSLLVMACSPNVKQTDGNAQQAQAVTERVTLQPQSQYADYLNRDVRDDIFYFVLPDRFHNANPDNDNGSKTVKISSGGFYPEVENAFHGGDIQGIEEKLDYLEGLGVSAIWMTPILRNRAVQDSYAHHGYWVIDFTQIDPHFGSNEDLKSLIDAAHERGMKIFFDIIINHTADVIKYEECHRPDGNYTEWVKCPYKSTEQVAQGDGYTPFLPAGEENLKTPAWLNDPKYYHNQGDSTWEGESTINGDFVGLDDLKTDDPEVIAGMIDIFKQVISDFRPDGFRVDTVKHVHMELWEEFSPAILEHARDIGLPQFFIFGEVYTGDPVILSSYMTRGNMPSVLDFGLQWAAGDVFYRDNSTDVILRLMDNDDYYQDADSDPSLLMNFLGNHDMGRAGHFLLQAQPDADDAELVARTELAHAYMYLSRGVPVLYYGDEQGFNGDGGDVGAREDMFPSVVDSYNDNNLFGTDRTTADDNFNTSHPLYQSMAALAKLRMGIPALRYGVQQNRMLDDNDPILAFARIDPKDRIEYLAVFNGSAESQLIEVPAFADNYAIVEGPTATLADGKLQAELPGFSFALYQARQPLPVGSAMQAKLADSEDTDDRLILTYDLPEVTPGALYKVVTEFKNDSGDYVLAATDYTLPYTAILDKKQIGSATQFRVTVDNLAGDSEQVEVTVNR